VFAGVLVEQLGAPLPAYPILMLTGRARRTWPVHVFALLGTAVAAWPDRRLGWYRSAGRAGACWRVLCRISLSPDSCVRQTESVFTPFRPALVDGRRSSCPASRGARRWPGAMHIKRTPLLLFDVVGATLWVGVALRSGWVFSPAIEDIVTPWRSSVASA